MPDTAAVEKTVQDAAYQVPVLKEQTLGKIAASFPSDTFVWLALGSVVASASMKLSGRSKDANFIGEWAPTFLALGIFSKLIKVERMLKDRL